MLRANRPTAGAAGAAAGARPGTGAAGAAGTQYQAAGAAGTGAANTQYQAAQPANTGAAGAANTQYQAPQAQQYQQPQYQAPGATGYAPATVNQGGAPATTGNAMMDLNGGILDNIDGMDNMGNFVTMDGSDFLYKATEQRVKTIQLVITYGKRYYQWVEGEDGENKIFHDSPTRLDDRYKLRFEIHWDEEVEEGVTGEIQFHMPAASAMRFIDYVKDLAKAGYGVGQVVTEMSISRQTQKNSSNRYSRAEFTMIGYLDPQGNFIAMAGPSTVGKQ